MLTTRALNRATLARQLLLRRHPLTPEQAVNQLAGLQAQAPLAPYGGLHARISPFTPTALSTLLSERSVVRAHLMRQTVHMVTAQDYVDFRPLFAHMGARSITSYFAKDLAGADIAEVATAARALLKGRTLTRTALGRHLAERWPDAAPNALAYTATSQLAIVQTPPRGLWGKTGQVTLALAEDWLAQATPSPAAPAPAGHPAPAPVGLSAPAPVGLSAPAPAAQPAPAPAGQPAPAPSAPSPRRPVERLLLRYLAAFGPATVADAQTWSGLTRLREVADDLAGSLMKLRGEDGAELLDLPDAPRPDLDVPAPPRFLPEYDNLLLSHADRTRVIPHGKPVPLPPGNGCAQGTLLVDGVWDATWIIARDKDSARLTITPFRSLKPQEKAAIEAQAGDLLAFVAPGTAHDIRFATP